jgi:hypothetical protein
MSKVNFDLIKEHVSTQYGDLTGVIQIDGHSNISSIYDLCKDHKFDMSDKFIIGFGLGESTINGIGKSNQVSCSILYVDKATYGENFEEIKRKIKSDGTLRLKKKDIDVKYSELGKYIKCYDFIMTTELSEYATTIEIDEHDE